jgi:hypothetical protein
VRQFLVGGVENWFHPFARKKQPTNRCQFCGIRRRTTWQES